MSDEHIALAQNLAIPDGLAVWFQEYDFASLDAERDQRLVIERTLAYGTRAGVRWLLLRYGRPAIQAWLSDLGHRRLPRRRYLLWCLLFDVPVQGRPSPIWPH
jgi:hypothetical protein